jgi:hypothetical protein
MDPKGRYRVVSSACLDERKSIVLPAIYSYFYKSCFVSITFLFWLKPP